MIWSNAELRATLNVILAKLEENPTSASEWRAIEEAMGQGLGYARRRRRAGRRKGPGSTPAAAEGTQ